MNMLTTLRNKGFLEEFIKCYRESPCLWKLGTKEYQNRKLRECAIDSLLAMSKKHFANADRDFVRKKIANIRTCFNREWKKVQMCKRLGQPDKYVPVLWYFDQLQFIMEDKELAAAEEGRSMDCDDSLEVESYYEEELSMARNLEQDFPHYLAETFQQHQSAEDDQSGKMPNDGQIVESETEILNDSTPSSVPPHSQNTQIDQLQINNLTEECHTNCNGPSTSKKLTSKKRRKVNLKESNKGKRPKMTNSKKRLLSLLYQHLKESDDDASVFAMSWACAFKKAASDQQLYATKFISEILFEAQLGTLHRNSVHINKNFSHSSL